MTDLTAETYLITLMAIVLACLFVTWGMGLMFLFWDNWNRRRKAAKRRLENLTLDQAMAMVDAYPKFGGRP